MESSEIISALIALIAVAISIATLQQSRNMIEESTRPYILVYVTETNFQEPTRYLVIKNFGLTGAKITKFETVPDLMFYSRKPGIRPFGKICNAFLAPGQTHMCTIDFIKSKEISDVSFDLVYESKHKTYSDKIILNLISESDNLTSRASTTNAELKIISYALQNLVEQNL